MRLLHWLLQGVFAIVVIMVLSSIGPAVETKYWPVYSKFKILESKKINDSVELVIQYTKYRNCDPQGYSWFVGDIGIGRRELATRQIRPYATFGPLGTQIIAPVRVKDLELADLPQLYAEIYSRCHPLWITRSVVYP